MNYKKTIYIIFILNTTLFSQTTFTYYENDAKDYHTESYGYELLKLSLEKTVNKYGNYKINKTPKMNKKRIILTLNTNTYKNLIVKLSATNEFKDKLSHINFPIDRGVVGYRVAFLSPNIKNKIEKFNTLDKLKELTIIQGRGWLDIDILKENGFKVKSVNNKHSAYNMLYLNRADLFFRGINEILIEQEEYKETEKLFLDDTFVLYYPLPRFFYTHKSNQEALKRINEGLKIAYYDGSIDKLFDKYYAKSIDFLELSKRKLYKIENPFLNNIDKSYEKYIYNPYK